MAKELDETRPFNDFAQWMRDNNACQEAQDYAALYEGGGFTIGQVFDDLGETANHPNFDRAWASWLMNRMGGKTTARIRIPLWKFMWRDDHRPSMLRMMRKHRAHLSASEKNFLKNNLRGKLPGMEQPDDFEEA